MLIIDIIGLAAVETFPDHLGQAPHPQQIGALEQGAAVFPTQARPRRHFLINGLKRRVLDTSPDHNLPPL